MREVFTWEVSCFVSVKGVEAKTVGCNSEYGNTSSTETRLTRLPTKKTQTNLACTFKSHYYFWELWLWGQVHILFKYFKTWIFANHFCCLFCMSYSFKYVWTRPYIANNIWAPDKEINDNESGFGQQRFIVEYCWGHFCHKNVWTYIWEEIL